MPIDAVQGIVHHRLTTSEQQGHVQAHVHMVSWENASLQGLPDHGAANAQ